jgi:hypothetical protein
VQGELTLEYNGQVTNPKASRHACYAVLNLNEARPQQPSFHGLHKRHSTKAAEMKSIVELVTLILTAQPATTIYNGILHEPNVCWPLVHMHAQ